MTELKVLGPIGVVGRSGDLEVGGPRQRRLLAALVVNANSVVSTRQLMEVLWEGRPPDGARRSFKAYVARLRAALAADGSADLIVTYPAGYALETDPERVDAMRFERLVDRARAELSLGEVSTAADLIDQALALWRGPPCDEFAGEEWVEPFAARLDASHALALELRVETRLAVGRRDEVLPEIEELIGGFPYRDGLRRLKMLALYRSGRQVDALREFQRYRQVLADEVGVEPGDDLVRLEQQILARDPELLVIEQSRRKIGDYELGERVGVSDRSIVYHAKQASVGREVALKVIRPELANDIEFIRRFEAEAQLLAALEHPNVVPLYDYWREPGGAFLVMRWLAGGSLRDRLVASTMEIEAVVRLTEDLVSALTAARTAGIAQSDVSPSTVLFDELGRAHITAVGIAAVSATGEQHTSGDDRGSAFATSRRDAGIGHGSARSAVASLGAVLYEALTGSPPTGPSESWCAAPLRPDVPAGLDDAIRTACAADPADRFGDPSALMVAVRSAVRMGERWGERPVGSAWNAVEASRWTNPYKGLRAFGEGDHQDFFGRDQLVDQLMTKIEVSRFLAVVGASGSGKSSAVRAGLIPRIRALARSVGHTPRPFVATMVPGSNPFAELERALTRLSQRPPSPLAMSAAGVGRCVREVLPFDTDLVLVIDQFEELFTSVDRNECDAFLDALSEVVADPQGQLRLVITIRADFYDRPLQHPNIGPLVRDNTIPVAPLDAEELESAITGPARRVGVDFEPRLVAELVADAARNPGTLPMLQYALTELFEARSGHQIQAAAYRGMGGLSGMIAARADALYADLPADQQVGVRRLFGQLVIPGEGAEDTRRRALVTELANVPDAVLDAYARARLISFDHDPVSRVPTVEIAHEALIRAWPRLRGWIDVDRETLRTLRQLTAAARSWDDRGRDSDELYRGARLAGALELRAGHEEYLNEVAVDFISASADAADSDLRRARRTTRRLRGLLVATAIALVLALIAGAVAISRSRAASERTEEAQLATLLVAASEAIGSEPQVASLLALEANRLSDDARAREALQSAVTADLRRIATWSPRSGRVIEMSLAGDGRHLAVATGSAVEVFDLETLRTVGDVHEDAIDVQAAPGRRLALSHDGRTIGTVRRVRSDDGRRDEMTYIDVDSGRRSSGPTLNTIAGSGTDSGDPFRFTHSIFNPAMQMLATVTDSTHSTVHSGDDLARATSFDGIIQGFSGDGSRMLSYDLRARTLTTHDTTEFDVLAELSVGDQVSTDGALLPPAALDFEGRRAIAVWANAVTVVDVRAEGAAQPIRIDAAETASVATSHDDRLAIASVDGVVQIHDLADGEPLGRPFAVRPGARGVDVAFRPDGSLVTGGREITIWSTSGVTALGPAADEGDYGARFSPDGETLVTTNHDGELFINDASTGRALARADIGRNGESVVATPMAFAPDGSAVIAVGGTGSDNRSGEGAFRETVLTVIDAATGSTIAERRLTNETSLDATAVAISPEGDHVVIGRREGGVELRSFPDLDPVIVDGDATAHLQHLNFDVMLEGTQRITSVAFSPDGRSYLGLSDQGILVSWSTATGEEEWRRSGSMELLAPLSDGRLLTSAPDGTLVVRSADGELDGPEFRGHFESVTAIDVAGATVATAADDGTVRLWDLRTGVPVGQPISVTTGTVDLSDDGRRMAVVNDGAVTIVSLMLDDWLAAACQLAGRNLTTEEWERYLPSGEPYRATCSEWSSGALR